MMIGIAEMSKMIGVTQDQVRGWIQRNQWGFPKPTLCNCNRHWLWDDMEVKRWKVKRLAQAIKHRQPNQWTVNPGLHLKV